MLAQALLDHRSCATPVKKLFERKDEAQPRKIDDQADKFTGYVLD